LLNLWNETEAAQEYVPLAAGKYQCRLLSGQLGKTPKGTPFYRLLFEVIGGAHDGERVAYRVWLTPNAIPYAKRDLKRLNITEIKQLEQPVPQGLLCEVTVALRTADDGSEFNRVKMFAVVGNEAPDPFAPVEA
jgi:hypothetical protein